MMINRIMIVLILGLVMSGCSLTKTKYVIKKQTRYLALPKAYTNDDIVIAKLSEDDRDKYINSTPEERDRLHIKLITDLYNNIGMYKIKLYNIGVYNNKMIDLLNIENSKSIEEINKLVKEVGQENVME